MKLQVGENLNYFIYQLKGQGSDYLNFISFPLEKLGFILIF